MAACCRSWVGEREDICCAACSNCVLEILLLVVLLLLLWWIADEDALDVRVEDGALLDEGAHPARFMARRKSSSLIFFICSAAIFN